MEESASPRPGDARAGVAGLLGWALASACLYLALHAVVAVLTEAEPSFVGTVLPWIPAATADSIAAVRSRFHLLLPSVAFLLSCGALVAIQLSVLRRVRGNRSPRVDAAVFGAGAGFLLLSLPGPVMLSSDVYFYALYGRMLSIHGVSPYGDAVPALDGDPFGQLLAGHYLPSWYGPAWTLASAGITWVTGDHVGGTILAFRFVAVVAALATAGLLWWCLRRRAPDRATEGLVMFLWSPLLILEVGFSGHNDMVMMFFVVLGVALHLRGWKWVAVVAFTVSALVKFLTGMLVLLYLWLVLREARGWWERLRFLFLGVGCAALVSVGAVMAARADRESPASRAAFAPDFYAHNLHELLFRGLRRLLGEDGPSARLPITFQGWWLVARREALMTPRPGAGVALGSVPAGRRVFVIAPHGADPLPVRVFDPATRLKGYVDSSAFDVIPTPPDLGADPELAHWQRPVVEWDTVRTANAWLRGTLWAGFALFGLVAAWKTTCLESFLVWSCAALLGAYYFIITEIWPWYALWALTLGALSPGRLPARMALVLSACVLTLHVTLGFQGNSPEWVYPYRSIPAFGLPLALFVVLVARAKILRHGTANVG